MQSSVRWQSTLSISKKSYTSLSSELSESSTYRITTSTFWRYVLPRTMGIQKQQPSKYKTPEYWIHLKTRQFGYPVFKWWSYVTYPTIWIPDIFDHTCCFWMVGTIVIAIFIVFRFQKCPTLRCLSLRGPIHKVTCTNSSVFAWLKPFYMVLKDHLCHTFLQCFILVFNTVDSVKSIIIQTQTFCSV